MRCAALTLFLVTVTFAGAEEPGIHIGAGSQRCGQWVEARRGKANEDILLRSMIASWVQGYIVGAANATAAERFVWEMGEQIAAGAIPPDPSDDAIVAFRRKMFGTRSAMAFDPPDSDVVQVWIDKYCSANPLNSIARAAATLEVELLGPAHFAAAKRKLRGKP